MQEKQELVYTADVDYRAGSPHLAHHVLYDRLVGVLRQVLRDLEAAGLPLSVLEIGAGHGGYTEPALAAGCQVTAVEMSRPSLARLAENFGTNANFKGVFDSDGTLAQMGSGFSLVLYVSVLHHIPDYLEALAEASSRLVPGGALLSLQDPIWYPRQSKVSRGINWAGTTLGGCHEATGNAALALWCVGHEEPWPRTTRPTWSSTTLCAMALMRVPYAIYC